jgi:hypothetical protein
MPISTPNILESAVEADSWAFCNIAKRLSAIFTDSGFRLERLRL